MQRLEFCSHAIRVDKYNRIGLIAGMLSVVAYLSCRPPGRIANQVAHGLVGQQVMLHLCQRNGQATAPQRLAHIQEFTIVHIPLNHISDRASGILLDIRRRHHLQEVRILQLLDGLPCGIIHADGRPARVDRIEIVV